MKNFLTFKGLEGNIPKYTIALITNKRIFVAILGAYYLTVPGVTPEWVGIILLASSLSGFVFEIPSGYLADKIGHKKGLIVWTTLLILSTLIYLVSDNVTLLILGGVFLNISNAFHSGTGTAFIHETLRALHREHEFREVMGKMKSIGFAVPILLASTTPFLVHYSWHLPFLIALITDCIGVVAVWSLIVPPVPEEHIEEIRLTNFSAVMREAWHLHFFRYALFSGILGGTLFAIGGFRAVYQSYLQIPVIWFGIFFGIGRALASILLWYSGSIQRYLKTPTRIYGFKLLLFSIFILILGLTDNRTIVVTVFILINAAQWGLNNVGYSVEATRQSKFKATLLSVKGQIQHFIEAGLSFALGFFIQKVGYEYSYLALFCGFILILTPLLYVISRDVSGRGEGADFDAGE